MMFGRSLLSKNRFIPFLNKNTKRNFAAEPEEGTKEWFDKVKYARSTMSKGEAMEAGFSSPQYYFTTTDDNYIKTTGTFLHQEVDKDIVHIMGMTEFGFRFRDTMVAFGPIVAFPKLSISWRIASVDEICEESLILFTLLEPKLEVLLIGVGEYSNVEKVRRRILKFCSNNKLRVEILSTMDACSAFNYLNADGRAVAACLYPPDDVGTPTRTELLKFGSMHDRMHAGSERENVFGIPHEVPGDNLIEQVFNYAKDKHKKILEKRESTRKALEKIGKDKPSREEE